MIKYNLVGRQMRAGWPDRRRKLRVMLHCNGLILRKARLKKRITGEWGWHYASGSYAVAEGDEWAYEQGT